MTITVLTFFRSEVIVRLVDVGVIDDHHCLNFLLVNRSEVIFRLVDVGVIDDHHCFNFL